MRPPIAKAPAVDGCLGYCYARRTYNLQDVMHGILPQHGNELVIVWNLCQSYDVDLLLNDVTGGER